MAFLRLRKMNLWRYLESNLSSTMFQNLHFPVGLGSIDRRRVRALNLHPSSAGTWWGEPPAFRWTVVTVHWGWNPRCSGNPQLLIKTRGFHTGKQRNTEKRGRFFGGEGKLFLEWYCYFCLMLIAEGCVNMVTPWPQAGKNSILGNKQGLFL